MITLKEIKQLVYAKAWRSEKNRELIRIIDRDRLNIEPMCLHALDSLGLNHLEIVELAGYISKKIINLPTATVDFLNNLQEKYGCVFTTKKYRLNGYVANWCGEYWGSSSVLLKLSEHYYKTNKTN